MSDLIREAPFGQVVRWVTKNKYFQYPEEKPNFKCPHSYTCKDGEKHPHLHPQQSHKSHTADVGGDVEKQNDAPPGDVSDAPSTEPMDPSIQKLDTKTSDDSISPEVERTETLGLQRTQTLPYTNERLAIEHELAIEKTKSRPIAPAVTVDGTILVDWSDP
jgi:DHA1 family multidrug resistance protein-like MFS transporter